MKPSVRELEKRLREEPDNLGLRVTLAGALLEVGREADAIELYRSVAIAYRDKGRTQQAIAVCRSILEIAPADGTSKALLETLDPRSQPAPPLPPTVPTGQPAKPKLPPRPSTSPPDETPLPRAVPHHEADPTTAGIEKLSALDLDTLERASSSPSPSASASVSSQRLPTADSPFVVGPPTERVERSYPVESDTEEETSPHGVPQLPEPPVVATAGARASSQAVLTTAFFAPIPPDRRAAVATKLLRRTFAPETTIIHHGESLHPMVVLLTGKLEARVERPEKPVIVVDALSPGDFIGEGSLLSRVPSIVDVVAATEVEVMLLLPRDFYELAAAFPALWAKLKEVAARRARDWDGKLTAS